MTGRAKSPFIVRGRPKGRGFWYLFGAFTDKADAEAYKERLEKLQPTREFRLIDARKEKDGLQ